MRRLALAISLVAGVQLSADQPDRVEQLTALLQRAGARVEQYLARAQSIMCLEVVQLQPMTSSWSNQGFWRTVESELRLSWQPDGDGRGATEAHTLRQLLRVNGKAPRKDDWNNCTAPEQQTSEPQMLSLLLPSERADYQFKLSGTQRVDGRSAFLVDYRVVKRAAVESSMVEGREDCVSFNLEGGMQGRIWIDVETHDVLRLDQRLSGLVDIPLPRPARRLPSAESVWTLERWDTTVRFKPVTFANPDETLVLPESLTSIRVTRGSGAPRLRTTTTYKNYQRFVTGARIVGQ